MFHVDGGGTAGHADGGMKKERRFIVTVTINRV